MDVSWDFIAQAGILIFGLSGTFLITRKNKWGFVLALAAQPFWFLTAYLNDQWGVFFNSLVYTSLWIYGLYNWFWKNDAEHGQVLENPIESGEKKVA